MVSYSTFNLTLHLFTSPHAESVLCLRQEEYMPNTYYFFVIFVADSYEEFISVEFFVGPPERPRWEIEQEMFQEFMERNTDIEH